MRRRGRQSLPRKMLSSRRSDTVSNYNLTLNEEQLSLATIQHTVEYAGLTLHLKRSAHHATLIPHRRLESVFLQYLKSIGGCPRGQTLRHSTTEQLAPQNDLPSVRLPDARNRLFHRLPTQSVATIRHRPSTQIKIVETIHQSVQQHLQQRVEIVLRTDLLILGTAPGASPVRPVLAQRPSGPVLLQL